MTSYCGSATGRLWFRGLILGRSLLVGSKLMWMSLSTVGYTNETRSMFQTCAPRRIFLCWVPATIGARSWLLLFVRVQSLLVYWVRVASRCAPSLQHRSSY